MTGLYAPHFDTTPVIGNGHYCYANATAMLLASAGETRSRRPVDRYRHEHRRRVERAARRDLLRLAAARRWHQPRLPAWIRGDRAGIGRWRARPAGRVSQCAEGWSALLGPLDMGLLLYQPGKGRPSGVDHFVLAYAMGDRGVSARPAGYPSVSLRVLDLQAAWRATSSATGVARIAGGTVRAASAGRAPMRWYSVRSGRLRSPIGRPTRPPPRAG